MAVISGRGAGWTIISMVKVNFVTNVSFGIDTKSYAEMLAVFIFKIGLQIAFLHLKSNFSCKSV